MRWFTSDLHFGHHNIIDYSGRPFVDVPEMNAGLVALWNDTVDSQDEVWVLGDFAMGRLKHTVPLAAELNGQITLVCGNHDAPWIGRSPSTRAKHAALYADTGMAVLDGSTVSFTIGGENVDCSHFPYEGDSHDEDRFVQHRPVDQGRWLLHGHVHEKWRQHGRQINVGVDVWAGRPVAETTIAELVSAGPASRLRLEWE